MKKTVQLLVSIAVLYLYGYTWKQKTLQTRIHGKWKHEQGCLTLRLDGIISWETADQKTVFGYY